MANITHCLNKWNIYIYNYIHINYSSCKGRKEMFYLKTHSTHFIYGYMVSGKGMIKDHSDSERRNPLPPHRLHFPINSKGSFICTSHRQDCTYHGLCYTSHGALARTRNTVCSKSELRSYPTWDFQKTLTG